MIMLQRWTQMKLIKNKIKIATLEDEKYGGAFRYDHYYYYLRCLTLMQYVGISKIMYKIQIEKILSYPLL